MSTEYNVYGEKLEDLLILRYAPIAMKLLRSGDKIPPGYVRPKRDLGVHLAMCQATAMVRRERRSLAMTKEDHWCIWPLVAFGMVEFNESTPGYEGMVTANFIEDRGKARAFFETSYPRLPEGEYEGFLLAPLRTAEFEPDLVLIYLKPAQLRSALMAAKYKLGELIDCSFDSIDSCVHATVPALKTGGYRITVPDPGEYERGLTDEDEMIFTVPRRKLPDLVAGLEAISERGFGYRQLFMEMRPDFPRPRFYDDLARTWGLDTGEIWKR